MYSRNSISAAVAIVSVSFRVDSQHFAGSAFFRGWAIYVRNEFAVEFMNLLTNNMHMT